MKITKKTRKPVADLTPADLQAFPIWEYATDEEDVDGHDESWVRPVAAAKIPAKSFSQLVAASFKASGGSEYPGYMIVSPETSTPALLDHSGGALFHARKQCFLIDLNGPAPAFLKRDCLNGIKDILKMDPERIFPLSFSLLIPISGEKQPRTGTFSAAKRA